MKIINFIYRNESRWLMVIVLVASFSRVSCQTLTENFITTTEPKEAVTSVGSNTNAIRSVMYYDGLGRPKQSILMKATPTGKDIITKIEYDEFGRRSKDYLPVPSNKGNGNYISNPNPLYSEYYGTGYNTDIYFSEKELENSPLGRVLKQAAPGDDWKLQSGHEIGFDYRANKVSDKVRLFRVSLTGDFIPSLHEQGNYQEGLLYKTLTTDENGHITEEYKTKLGQVILKRAFQGTNKLDTYYIYDGYDNLTFVIPPRAAARSNINQSVLDELCYQYRYNDRNLLTEKKLPGKGWELMVYDRQDRLVAVQDSVMRESSNWLFTKYDKFGRVVYTGFTTGSKSEIELLVKTAANHNNEKTDYKNGFVKNGLNVMYMNNAFPTDIKEVFTVNYYDDYKFEQVDFPNTDGLINSEPGSVQNRVNTRGALTASMNRILGTDSWEKNYYFYDSKLRTRYSRKKNHLGGETTIENEYNFRGLLTKSTTNHKRTNSSTNLKIVDNFTYSAQERLLKQTRKINQNPKEEIFVNQYNLLGFLTGKGVGGESGQPSLQQLDYSYNIRGWLTGINDTGQLQKPGQTVDLFAFDINYNEPVPAYFGQEVQPLYNGNIAETRWRTASDNILRGYGYAYDGINRLENAYYQKPDSVIPLPQTFDEYLSYDLNGNISSLQRYSGDDSPAGTYLSDDLEYTYISGTNRLKSVSDSTGSSTGFDDGNTVGADYKYDPNGNMITDKNKGIGTISYNHLNLPVLVKWSSTKKIEYIYNAAGEKVQKKVTNGSTITTTDYLGGFQYNNNLLEFFPHPEGYVKVTATNTDINNPGYTFNYVYNYTDHLGNVRLSYAKDPQTGNLKILDESHYYPFGLKHSEYAKQGFVHVSYLGVVIAPVADNPYKYKYNGKEYQDELGLNWHDYGWRNYDATIGRWMNIDFYSEKFPSINPYNYVTNNPISAIDPDGRDVYFIIVVNGGAADGYDAAYNVPRNSDHGLS